VSTRTSLFDSAFLAKLEQLHLLARRMFRGERRAERKTRQIGASLEFADYREYTPGDEPRSIDWNAYGRLERLFVKLHEQEQDLPVTFLVDCSASMRWLPEEKPDAPGKFDHARRLCAALAYIALANLDRVNIHFFAANSIAELGVARGKAEFHSVLKFLDAPPEADGPTRLMHSVQSLAQRTRRRGLVFVISDFFDPHGYEEPLGLLLHGQFEVHCLQVLAPEELAPTAIGDLSLRDVELDEAGAMMDITANENLLRRYREEITKFNGALESFCLRRGIAFAQVSTDTPFEDIVLRALRDGVMVR
jgi:uncharacterized protein (DUF58 family)